MPIPTPTISAMHDVNWCENCGSMIGWIQIRKPARNGLTELVDQMVCNCRGRPKPAPNDRP